MADRCLQCGCEYETGNANEDTSVCTSCGNQIRTNLDETVSIDQSNTTTLGHFRLLDQVGSGAHGTVWRARDSKLDRIVAIKIPRLDSASAHSKHFVREARAAAQLRHPNVVHVHEVREEENCLYIVSDFIEGITLADWLADRSSLPAKDAAACCLKIAEGLHHAHKHGVIHRDLKPSNIMLNAANEPHIMDFGLAKREEGKEETLTVDGKILGTPAYMPPEQAQGNSHAADQRSDIYSLGIILYEMIVGKTPFRGNTATIIHKVIHVEPERPRTAVGSIPRDLETICLNCIAKSPDDRYQTVEDVRNDLARFIEGMPISKRRSSGVRRGLRWCARHPAVAGLSATCLILLALLLLVATRQTNTPTESTFRITDPSSVTPTSTHASSPSWSPDEDMIVFSSNISGNLDLYKIDSRGTLDKIPLTTNPADDWQADCSVNGEIVFRSERDGGGLFIIDEHRSPPTRISRDGVYPRWSPDGTEVLFLDQARTDTDDPPKAFIFNRLSGQTRRILTSFRIGYFYGKYPPWIAWNPKGDGVFFHGRGKNGEWGYWSYHLDSGDYLQWKATEQFENRLEDDGIQLGEFVWATSSSFIASGMSNGKHGLWRIGVNPSRLEFEDLTLLISDDSPLTQHRVSPNGKRLTWVKRNDQTRIWRFPMSSPIPMTLDGGTAITTANATTHDLSRDGEWIAFELDENGRHLLSYRRVEDPGTDSTPWVRETHGRLRPRWSPDATELLNIQRRDGRDLVVLSERREHKNQLVTYSRGSDVANFITAPNESVGSPFDWSRSGKIVFSHAEIDRNGVRQNSLAIMDRADAPDADRNMSIVARDFDFQLWQGFISPNEEHLVFKANHRRDFHENIYVASARGMNQGLDDWQAITKGSNNFDKPRWSHDGKHIYYFSWDDRNVWRIGFDATLGRANGEPVKVTNFDTPSKTVYEDKASLSIGVSRDWLTLPITEKSGTVFAAELVED